ncbi:MAG: hypothetical protein HY303_15410 [Candidatus Wallbacteria bacterium]|nr:hypothetical protein [Candidatus Wallbacteria bacterium]
MEIFYEVKNLLDERTNRTIVYGRFQETFTAEVEKRLWLSEVPTLVQGDPGEPTDAWGSLAARDHKLDVTQLIQTLTAVSAQFPAVEIHLRADECPGFVLDGKTEIVTAGKAQRYSRQFSQFCEENKPEFASWDFLIDARIWTALLQKHQELSENQILTTRLARALDFTHSSKLKDPFLGFPVDYPGMDRKKKELKVPKELADRMMAICQSLKRTKQEMTERAIYAGLMK